jgi:hypothetical protein
MKAAKRTIEFVDYELELAMIVSTTFSISHRYIL